MTVVATYTFDVKPGRSQDSIATAKRSLPMLTKLGADRARLLTPAGGPMRTLVVMLDFASMLSYGEFVDNIGTDPAIQELATMTLGPDAPNELPVHEVYTQLAP